jgi:geranylgeranyl pyrophosphate synthase
MTLYNYSQYKDRFNHFADQYLKAQNTDIRLQQAMQYALLNGGKRIRPLLVYAANKATGGNIANADFPALAIEMVHSFSLVHDDLPALDNDELRRGVATCHVIYGEASAILTGDALLALAFEALTECTNTLEPQLVVDMIKELSQASGPSGIIAGQMKDIEGESKELTRSQLQNIHALKTGTLIRASIRLGALSSGRYDKQHEEALGVYANSIGLAYQIKDDLLDIQGDPNIMGKNKGSDLILNKTTYPAMFGIEKSEKTLLSLIEKSKDAITCFGSESLMLEQIASMIIDREA